jgi:uncharacterized membrane protein
LSFVGIDFRDVGQILTVLGIPGVLITIFMQIRSYKKDQRELAEKNRAAITTEINDKTTTLFERIEGRLEAIKIAAIITKEDIGVLKVQLNDLRRYVDELDKEGTVEWQKTKPFIIEKISDLDRRIEELDNRFTFEVEEMGKIARFEIKKNRNEVDREHGHDR